jgi:hypothetical protein
MGDFHNHVVGVLPDNYSVAKTLKEEQNSKQAITLHLCN